jgi:hypothetical protein
MLIIIINKELHHLYFNLYGSNHGSFQGRFLMLFNYSLWMKMKAFEYIHLSWNFMMDGNIWLWIKWMLIYGFHSQMINGTTWTSISTFICFKINQNLSTNVIWFMSNSMDMTLILSSQLMPW